MIKITGTTETMPDNLVFIHAEDSGREVGYREVGFGPVDRRALLTALNAEPDETDYQEVVAENTRLGNLVAANATRGRGVRLALGLPDTASFREVFKRIDELLDIEGRDKGADEERAAAYNESRALTFLLNQTLATLDRAIAEQDEDLVTEARDALKADLPAAPEESEDADGDVDEDEDPREDQDQIDRSWALEKAGAVLQGLIAVGAFPAGQGGVALVRLAEWIVSGSGEESDRG